MVVKSRHHQTNGATGARFGWEHAPHSPSQSDLEIGVVGCLIENPSAIPEALSVGLEAGDFMDPELQTLFCCVVAMHAEGRHVDAETVAHDLIYFELVKDGDTAKLVKLRDGVVHAREYGCFPSKVKEYAKCLVDASVRRSLHNFAGRLAKDNQQWKYSDLSALITEYRQRLDNIASRLDGQSRDRVRRSVVSLLDVEAQQIHWLWQGWIPYGMITLIDGDPGQGKSQLTINLAARVSNGWGCPPFGEGSTNPAHVLLLNAEDDLARTTKPRLIAAGADMSKIITIDDDKPITLPGSLPRLMQVIEQFGVKLVVIDPLMAFINRAYESRDDHDMRSCLREVAKVASLTGAAFVLVRHLNKMSGGPAMYRGGGSIGIIGASRSALIVGRHPQKKGVYVIAPNKMNLCEPPTPLTYRIIPSAGASRIEWIGHEDIGIDELLAWRPPKGEQRNDAKEFLLELLAGGPVLASIIQDKAKQLHIAERTLDRAKADLRIQAYKAGLEARWYWKLPEEDAG